MRNQLCCDRLFARLALRPTQLPIQWVRGTLSLGLKRPGHEADHSPPSSVQRKNKWSYTFLLPYAFHDVHTKLELLVLALTVISTSVAVLDNRYTVCTVNPSLPNVMRRKEQDVKAVLSTSWGSCFLAHNLAYKCKFRKPKN